MKDAGHPSGNRAIDSTQERLTRYACDLTYEREQFN